MPQLTIVHRDITREQSDALVNAANRRMRGGGGVDGAIHAAGGPAILADCVARFPAGLATGAAGWTTAGNLDADYVIHAVGPNFTAGERDPELLVSCYRGIVACCAELGVRRLSSPLISAGIYGWPLEQAVEIALTEYAAAEGLDSVRIVERDAGKHARIADLAAAHGVG